MKPSEIGDIGEAILITELKMRQYSVAIPFGHADPYDLIVVTNSGKPLKVQVKTTSSSRPRSLHCYRFLHVKNFGDNDIYAFLLVNDWFFMTADQAKQVTSKHSELHINSSKVNLNNFEIFETI